MGVFYLVPKEMKKYILKILTATFPSYSELFTDQDLLNTEDIVQVKSVVESNISMLCTYL